AMVGARDIIETVDFMTAKSKLTAALGKDISGSSILTDIAKMPHGLIAGATGSGKSVCINSIIMSILYKASPEEVKLLMIDPKVVELGVYNGIPHLLVPVVTDPRKAAGALGWAVTEMEQRYAMFAQNGVRDLAGFNKLVESNPELELNKMPQIVIIIDELADLMMTAPGEVEDSINRIAAKARAAGMHLLIATQRPSVDVVTGVIKANIPTRIAFAVSSQVDSRTILDSAGAEKLLGRGDMLFNPIGSSKPNRLQGCYVSDEEVEAVVEYIKSDHSSEYDEDVMQEIERQAAIEKKNKTGVAEPNLDDDDPMLNAAIETVVELGQASTSMLQRKLKLGYARAARLIDVMEERGVVGPYEGSKPRQVLLTKEMLLEMQAGEE
ncbi:MAG: DNA translocase FtsK, partial [Clostridia bacterium]|nr:DNA translocase FtsK [Clostridia bacterium]